MMGPTLFTAVTCPPVEHRFFFFWKYTEPSHKWAELARWKEPLHYGTDFCTLKQCVKCWEKYIEHNEQYGP